MKTNKTQEKEEFKKTTQNKMDHYPKLLLQDA